VATKCSFEPNVKISRMAFKEMFEKGCEEESMRQKISMRRVAITRGLPTMQDRRLSGAIRH
jgi:biotin carboxylase